MRRLTVTPTRRPGNVLEYWLNPTVSVVVAYQHEYEAARVKRAFDQLAAPEQRQVIADLITENITNS